MASETEEVDDVERLARKTYETYQPVLIFGRPMTKPSWEELPTGFKDLYRRNTKAVLDHVDRSGQTKGK